MTAALTAKTTENTVLLVTKGYGTFYYGPGVIDLLGNSAEKPGKAVMDPWQQLPKMDRSHPYSRLGAKVVRQAFQELSDLLAQSGYPLTSLGTRNMLLPTAVGSIRPTYLAPPTLVNGALNHEGDLLVVGIDGFYDFYPRLVAENLISSLQKHGLSRQVRWCQVDLGLDVKRPLSSYDLAIWFEQPANVEKVIERLKPRLGEEERVGFPAVLGLDKHQAIWQQVEQGLGRKVFEIPTIPPSVPGIRLHRALTRLMAKQGIEVITGHPVVSAGTVGKKVQYITVDTPGQPSVYQADNYVLAAGGLGGGGLVAYPGRVEEAIFGLAVSYEAEVDNWSREKLLAPQGQPYAAFGLLVDQYLRPVDRHGKACFSNLYAAGSILAHCDPVAERSSGGLQVVTGFACGRECRKEGGDLDSERTVSGRPVPKVQYL